MTERTRSSVWWALLVAAFLASCVMFVSVLNTGEREVAMTRTLGAFGLGMTLDFAAAALALLLLKGTRVKGALSLLSVSVLIDLTLLLTVSLVMGLF